MIVSKGKSFQQIQYIPYIAIIVDFRLERGYLGVWIRCSRTMENEMLMADVKPVLQDGIFHARLDELKNKNGDPPWAEQR